MDAQHTTAPWKVARSLYQDDKKPFSVYRGLGTPEYQVMRDKAGRERLFATEDEARAAIAKATGATQ